MVKYTLVCRFVGSNKKYIQNFNKYFKSDNLKDKEMEA